MAKDFFKQKEIKPLIKLSTSHLVGIKICVSIFFLIANMLASVTIMLENHTKIGNRSSLPFLPSKRNKTIHGTIRCISPRIGRMYWFQTPHSEGNKSIFFNKKSL